MIQQFPLSLDHQDRIQSTKVVRHPHPVARIFDPALAVDYELVVVASGRRHVELYAPQSVPIAQQPRPVVIPAIEISGQRDADGMVVMKQKNHFAILNSRWTAADRLQMMCFAL